jgi:type IV pilus assembly protein PilQ
MKLNRKTKLQEVFMTQKIIVMVVMFSMVFLGTSCTSKKKIVTDDFATDSADASTSSAEGFPDEELSLDDPIVQTVSAENKKTEVPLSGEDSIEKELDAVTAEKPQLPTTPVVDTVPAPVPVSAPVPIIAEAPVPPANLVPVTNEPAKISTIATIKDVQFKSNDSGGALMISADQPLDYTTRLNSATNQIVIEVQNVKVPQKFKRPLNTKDMSSSIGHIDIYQKNKSNIARFVVQLRQNADQPLIQPEGTSLMVIGSKQSVPHSLSLATQAKSSAADSAQDFKIKNDPSADVEVNSDLTNESIMNTADMDEYLSNNTKFYGKKISIETTDMNVKDVLKFISEESGVNMIFDDSITGTISLKLRKVPWDQAFVLVLKSKALSYRRQGTVLRIATNDTLVKEEKIAIELKQAKTIAEPLIVKNFSINYADINELEKKLTDYISSNDKDSKAKGRITSDKRTNMLIVTETATKLKQVEALIKALDTQPQQVMIEARVIEASEAFAKSVGVDWGLNRGTAFNGSPRVNTNIGQPWADPSPIQISPSLGYTAPQAAAGAFKSSLWFGKLGALGDLDIQLALNENEEKIKILSTPRVTVLTNTQASINQIFKKAQGTVSTTVNGVTTTEPKFVDVGVKLNVTPQISNLGTVRMLIDVIRTGAQGDSTNSRDMKTEVIVKSGDTTVIGGVFQSDTNRKKNGIPGLKDIPILGTIFRGESNETSKTELMVFVTPKILAAVVPLLKAEDAMPDPPESTVK